MTKKNDKNTIEAKSIKSVIQFKIDNHIKYGWQQMKAASQQERYLEWKEHVKKWLMSQS